MPRFLISIGLICIVFAGFWYFAEYHGFQGFPGDIQIKTERGTLHFPLVASIVISIVLTGVLWLFNSLRR